MMVSPARKTSAKVSLVGAPTDVGASTRGSSMGPEALRVAGVASALADLGVDVRDAGDVHGPLNPWLPGVDGYRHLREVQAWCRLTFDAVLGELEAGRLPILLGGDHSLAIGTISAAARHARESGRRIRVLWLDSHADFNTAELTPTGNLHGMPVACLCGLGPRELVEIGGAGPAIDPADVRQIGIRCVDPGEKQLVHRAGLEVFDMRFIDEVGMREVMERSLAGLSPEGWHLHVSFDVDFLDPLIAPGVGTAVPGGATYREAQLCMEMIAETGCVGSIDVVEVNPALDHRNRTAEIAVDLLESLFGKTTLMRGRAGR
jgi:arginase